jgi:hypothetical protein
MAEVKDRETLEAGLARKLANLQRSQLERLMEALGDPPQVERIPPDLWEVFSAEQQAALGPFLQKLFLGQAEQMLEDNPGIGVDWSQVHEAAVRWSSSYGFELVRGLTQRTQAVLREAVAAYFDQAQTIGDLKEALAPAFGVRRSGLIAVTEVTRAASEGEREMAQELGSFGIEMEPYWQTNEDEIAMRCTFCGPRNGQKITDGVFPPGHPGCQCWANWLIKALAEAA